MRDLGVSVSGIPCIKDAAEVSFNHAKIRASISNYAFNPIAEQALRSIQIIVPQRVNAALGFRSELEAFVRI